MHILRSILDATSNRFRVFICQTGRGRIRLTHDVSKIITFTAIPSCFTLQRYGAASNSYTGAKKKKPRLPRNHEIEARLISVVDECGKISGPHRTKDFLEDFDFENKSLVTVVEGNPDDGRLPLCKVIDRVTLRKYDLVAQKSKPKSKGVATKVIEMSWVVENHDLDTKMKRLTEFLEKGYHVNLLLKAKKRGRFVTQDEAEQLLEKISETVQNAGGKHQKLPEGEILGNMDLSFVPKKRN